MAKAEKSKEEQVLSNQSLQFLRNYINNPSPVGFESTGQKLWLNYLKKICRRNFYRPVWYRGRRGEPRPALQGGDRSACR